MTINTPRPANLKQDDVDSQTIINQKILTSLHDIHKQNQAIAKKIGEQNADIVARIDHLEQSVTKKATIAGAMAGAIAGVATSGVFSIGMEFVKAKFGW